MSATSHVVPESVSLAAHGLSNARTHANLRHTELLEHALRRGEGRLTNRGAFVGVTAPHTGRSPNDKFVVEEPSSSGRIWRDKNPALSEAHFDALQADVKAHLSAQSELFVQDLFGGADARHRLPVRFISPSAWHAPSCETCSSAPDGDLRDSIPASPCITRPRCRPSRPGTAPGAALSSCCISESGSS
jgi:phosphoenolpyruvate carboxykinase (ATP)